MYSGSMIEELMASVQRAEVLASVREYSGVGSMRLGDLYARESARESELWRIEAARTISSPQ